MSPTDKIPPLQAPTGTPHRAWTPDERAELQRVLAEDCAADRPSFDMDAAVEAALTAYYCNDKLDVGWGPEARGDMRAALTAALPLLVGNKAGDDMHDESVDRDAARWLLARRFLSIREIRSWTGWPGNSDQAYMDLLDDEADAAIRAEKEASK